MSSFRRLCAVAALLLPLLGCGQEQRSAALPPPQEPTADSVAHFCNMAVLDHAGPKGQIFVQGKAEPVWFASVRDAFAFTFLPEEPKNLSAIYVNDMSKSIDGQTPPPGSWIEAHQAWFVVHSDYRGGMGGQEIVPFADEIAAAQFAASHGGKLKRFAAVSERDVFGSAEDEPEPAATDITEQNESGHAGHAHHSH